MEKLASHTKTINLKYQLQHRMNWITWWIHSVPDVEDYFKYINKKNETVVDNLPIRIYVTEIKIGLHLE